MKYIVLVIWSVFMFWVGYTYGHSIGEIDAKYAAVQTGEIKTLTMVFDVTERVKDE